MSYVPLIYGISATYLWVRFVLTMGKVARNYEVSATYIQPHSTIIGREIHYWGDIHNSITAEDLLKE